MAYYISPRFLNKLAVHITKNFLSLPNVRVPLILGVHGRKGEGKSFQCDLAFERMKVEVVHISGGELESPDAGDPARLLRLRYREAAELSRVRGRMVTLLINDLDAGAGRFDSGTQYTVNTQLVNATLMNIADNPTNVQLPGSYDENPIRRVPIIVTGNDFSTLYAPLIRDGRMEKFYWEPDHADRIGILQGIFEPDGLSATAIAQLVDTFPTQAIDFFGALRSRIYDEQVLHYIESVGIERVSHLVVNSESGPPQFPKPDFSLEHLLDQGKQMVGEQERVRDMQLVREYNEALQAASIRGSQVSSAPAPESWRSPTQSPGDNGQREASVYSAQPVSVNPATNVSTQGSALSAEVAQQVQSLLNQGYRVAVEYVDQRRFRTNSWQSCATIPQHNSTEAIAHLEDCLNQHPRDYVRLIGINPGDRTRIVETIIQRPN